MGHIENAAINGHVEDTGAGGTTRLLRLAHELARAARPEHAAELAAAALSDLTGGGVAAVFRACTEPSGELAAVAGPVTDGALAGFPALASRAAAASEPVRARADELAELAAFGCRCDDALAAPVLWHGQLFAVLVVAVPEHDQLSLHPQLLGTVADLLGASLANALGARAEGRLDTLTALPNHRAFHEELDALLRSGLADAQPVSLALLDVDGLGAHVDARGRASGDAVLRSLARAAESLGGVSAFRIGGDEFALLLRAGADEAARAGSAVAEAVARATGGLVSVSAGVAAFPADARTQDELVHQADLALHASKRLGREQPVESRSQLTGAVARSNAEVNRAGLHDLMTWKPVRDALVDELAPVAAGIRALGGRETRESMLEHAADQLRTLLGATACVISRLDGDLLREAAVVAPSPWVIDNTLGYLLDDYPLTREVLETGEPRTVNLADPDVDPSEAYVLAGYGMEANLLLPLVVDGSTWGLVEIFDARPRQFAAGDVVLAELVVGQVESLLGRFDQAEAMQQLYSETLGSLSNALEAKDGYTSDHAQEVGDLAVAVARRVGLGGPELGTVELGALLHDIGKIRIPESILNKPGPLDDDEWEIMRTHPEAGERILSPIASLADVLPIVRSSHERWDGDGYPDRLAGEEIPVGARIVSVCDAYRAMIEQRPYRAPRDPEIARAILVENAGSQFDPECVRALLEELDAEAAREPDVVTLYRPAHLRSA